MGSNKAPCKHAVSCAQQRGSLTQILLQHYACPVQESKFTGMSHNKFPLSVRSWMFQHWSSWMRCWTLATTLAIVQLIGFLVWSSFSMVVQPTLNQTSHMYTTHALFPKHLFYHCQGFCSTFPEIRTKFDANSLFHSCIHCAISTHQVS